mgnify:CR=1 FL=1
MKVASPVRVNKKSEVTTWLSMRKDGELLKLLFSQGAAEKFTSSKIKDQFLQFQKYATRTLNSACQGLRKTMQSDV